MSLPHFLEEGLQALLAPSNKKSLAVGSEALSDQYRAQKGTKGVDPFAYLAVRLPATFAAVTKVLEEIKKSVPNFNPRTLLDLGSGPGTALFAATELFSFDTITAFEKETTLLNVAKQLGRHLSVDWRKVDLETVEELPKADLVILSYAFGELSEKGREKLLLKAAKAAEMLVIIEPGTPAGFERIRKIRTDLIVQGKQMVAPCPHMLACPIVAPDWCHFSVRLSRSSLHRQLKGGTLGYEDEKFSYVAVCNAPVSLPEARILRHPQKRTGHIHFTLCTRSEGLQSVTISKKTPSLYKEAKDLEWGDSFKSLQLDN